MRTRATTSPRTTAVRATAAAFGLAAAVLGTLGTGSASADPVSLTLDYSCVFPQIGSQSLRVQANADLSGSVQPGFRAVKITLSTVNTLGSDLSRQLYYGGVRTLGGSTRVSVKVIAPQGDVTVKPTLGITPTGVTQEGPASFPATGSASLPYSSKPDTWKVVLGNIDLNLSLKDATGTPIDLDGDGDGTFTVPCAQLPGQNNVLAQSPPAVDWRPATDRPARGR
ncbi:hypothetical protein RKE29_00140 [Streptomyces sp. B1866]|uniref:DUF6801 domain-containing protein n=1 Tax=Streptomyces sp. B1866 TaxID=3075431 RepID=UPI0028902589|nr:DUF6801 domain-containing protein [Streptomyces sp. B1866]MDT3395083.1 hypothetical protein [Streptomyces sp. B1866]